MQTHLVALQRRRVFKTSSASLALDLEHWIIGVGCEIVNPHVFHHLWADWARFWVVNSFLVHSQHRSGQHCLSTVVAYKWPFFIVPRFYMVYHTRLLLKSSPTFVACEGFFVWQRLLGMFQFIVFIKKLFRGKTGLWIPWAKSTIEISLVYHSHVFVFLLETFKYYITV